MPVAMLSLLLAAAEPAGARAIEARIRSCEDIWAGPDGGDRNDRLADCLADDMVQFSLSGETRSKAQLLAQRGGNMDAGGVDRLQVKFIAPYLAVSFGWSWRRDAKGNISWIRFMDTWRPQDGIWRIAASHSADWLTQEEVDARAKAAEKGAPDKIGAAKKDKAK